MLPNRAVKAVLIIAGLVFPSAVTIAVGQEKSEEVYAAPSERVFIRITTAPDYTWPEDQHRTCALVIRGKKRLVRTVAGEWVGPAEVVWSPDSSFVAIADTVHGAGEDAIDVVGDVSRSPKFRRYPLEGLSERIMRKLKGSGPSAWHYKSRVYRLSVAGPKITAALEIDIPGYSYSYPIGMTLGASQVRLLGAPAVSKLVDGKWVKMVPEHQLFPKYPEIY